MFDTRLLIGPSECGRSLKQLNIGTKKSVLRVSRLAHFTLQLLQAIKLFFLLSLTALCILVRSPKEAVVKIIKKNSLQKYIQDDSSYKNLSGSNV